MTLYAHVLRFRLGVRFPPFLIIVCLHHLVRHSTSLVHLILYDITAMFSAERAWLIPEVRRLTFSHCAKSKLLQLLTLSRASFPEVVSQLYKEMTDKDLGSIMNAPISPVSLLSSPRSRLTDVATVIGLYRCYTNFRRSVVCERSQQAITSPSQTPPRLTECPHYPFRRSHHRCHLNVPLSLTTNHILG
jgi:hypothetical protein